MPKPQRPGKKLPTWMQHEPKRTERQTDSRNRQTAKASGLKAKKGVK